MEKKIVKNVKVDEGYALELEKAFYEMEVAKQRVDRLAVLGVNPDLFDRAIIDESEKFKSYNIVWQFGINKYIPKEDRIYGADFDFAEQVFVIYLGHNEDNNICSCHK